jgi:hypothetical protein
MEVDVFKERDTLTWGCGQVKGVGFDVGVAVLVEFGVIMAMFERDVWCLCWLRPSFLGRSVVQDRALSDAYEVSLAINREIFSLVSW